MTITLRNIQGNVIHVSEEDKISYAIREAKKSGKKIENLSFYGEQFRLTSLDTSDLKGAQFVNCLFDQTSITGSDTLVDAQFKNCSMVRINICEIKIKNCLFYSCNLHEASFFKSKFEDTSFKNCNLKLANFSESVLPKKLKTELIQQEPLSILLNQPGKLYAYKFVRKNGFTTFFPFKYEIGKTYDFSNRAHCDPRDLCGPGLNVATLDWCKREMIESTNKLIVIEFESKDIACIPIGSDGKFRLLRGKVVGTANKLTGKLIKRKK